MDAGGGNALPALGALQLTLADRAALPVEGDKDHDLTARVKGFAVQTAHGGAGGKPGIQLVLAGETPEVGLEAAFVLFGDGSEKLASIKAFPKDRNIFAHKVGVDTLCHAEGFQLCKVLAPLAGAHGIGGAKAIVRHAVTHHGVAVLAHHSEAQKQAERSDEHHEGAEGETADGAGMVCEKTPDGNIQEVLANVLFRG